MSFVCSIISLELAINGDVLSAIIAIMLGIIIDAIIIDALETLATTKGGEDGR